jgi:hypothetical protein
MHCVFEERVPGRQGIRVARFREPQSAVCVVIPGIGSAAAVSGRAAFKSAGPEH